MSIKGRLNDIAKNIEGGGNVAAPEEKKSELVKLTVDFTLHATDFIQDALAKLLAFIVAEASKKD